MLFSLIRDERVRSSLVEAIIKLLLRQERKKAIKWLGWDEAFLVFLV